MGVTEVEGEGTPTPSEAWASRIFPKFKGGRPSQEFQGVKLAFFGALSGSHGAATAWSMRPVGKIVQKPRWE